MPTSPRHIPFVGRVQEMAELKVALDDALVGRGGLVMLAGEPGIGKTRLTEELTAIAKDRGALVAWGACYEGGSAPPYWPWTQVIRSLLTEPSVAVMNALETRGAVIADIVPEIDDMLPDMQPAPEVDPTQARFRLFDSVTSFLNEVAISQPVILVIDDLHWADRSTLELLEFVARDVATRPMLLVGSYRDMELSRQHPLSETLATLARARGFRRIPLWGLGSEDVGRLVEAVGGIRPPPALIDEIHDRTEGNPFFIVEVTRDLAREAAVRGGNFDSVGSFRIPEGVREAIGVRLNRLSEECNQVLRTASLLGRVFDFALLAAVMADPSEDVLPDLIDEAIVSGAVREVPGTDERYEFTHALIHETLAEELPTRIRTRLHARIVDAIETIYADRLADRSAELSFHCAEAGTMVAENREAHYARMAGERAVTAYAWTEARAFFEQALEALGTSASPADRAAILFGLGRSELQSLSYPDIQRGWDNVARAFDTYEEIGDSRAAVEVAIRSQHGEAAHVHGTARVFSRALELVPSESVEAGHLFRLHGCAIRYEEEDAAGSLKALERALEISRHTGDRRLETGVLADQSEFSHRDFDDDGAVELGLQAIELAREIYQPFEEATSHFIVAVALVALGDPDGAWLHTEAQIRLHEKIGRSQATPLYVQYIIAYLRGDLSTMNEVGGVLESESPGDTVQLMLVGIGAWHVGNRSGLGERIRAAREDVTTGPLLLQRVNNLRYLALASRLMNSPADAIWAGEIARSILSMTEITPADEANARIAAGLAAVVTGDAKEAVEHHQRLKNLRGSGIGWGFPICADRLLGLLAHTGGMPEEAQSHFEDALKITAKAGYHLEFAWTCYDFAESLIDSDEPAGIEKAISLIDDGLEITREHGLVAIEERLIGLQETAASIATPTPSYPRGLSAREVEVLRLLATGRTNREIAEDLVISARTVERHISNLYTKIGVRNRAEATSFVLARLAAPPTP
ncbi:MAG: AAA family ATPase [Chloroflexi bacterium]|nr:AAA family ATPase [Chloroflexota bacterium]